MPLDGTVLGAVSLLARVARTALDNGRDKCVLTSPEERDQRGCGAAVRQTVTQDRVFRLQPVPLTVTNVGRNAN